MFDLFIGNKQIFVDKYSELIKTLETVSKEKNIQIYYTEGNHDFYLKPLFHSNKKITVLGDIFIGTDKNLEIQNGYTIKIPSTVNDLSNAQQRVAVAMNGFHQLNNLRKDANWNYWMDYSQIKIGYAYNTYQAKGL